eukprot:TRINITY_DN339_c1_g1_i1.p1 TRINITY_DN339_c1_g1~~TRINITY_DN339_c1_g1_i1.p1  ORF type:complete len:1016 (+),score=115.89 TRINITY_DN339_c1_g1_i1:181-3048(+)
MQRQRRSDGGIGCGVAGGREVRAEGASNGRSRAADAHPRRCGAVSPGRQHGRGGRCASCAARQCRGSFLRHCTGVRPEPWLVHHEQTATKTDPFCGSVFPTEVMQEVRQLVANPGVDDPALKDLSTLPFVTIDYDHSMDLDQALYICKDKGTGFIVYYALADAAYYVRPGSALFAEALRRGSSFYLPGLCVPMLPVELSEGVISLNEGEPSRALVFEMRVGEDGSLTDTQIYRAKVVSRKKLEYEDVQRFHDCGCISGSPLCGQPFSDSLSLLRPTAERLASFAVISAKTLILGGCAGVEAVPGPKGATWALAPCQQCECERWNEQLSLACNLAGGAALARECKEHGLWRSAGLALDTRLAGLSKFLDILADAHKDDTWRWRKDAETVGTYLARLPREETMTAPGRITRAVRRAATSTRGGSEWLIAPEGNGNRVQARFSSPMRECAGIFVHCLLAEARGWQAASSTRTNLREQVIEAAKAAKRIQSSLNVAVRKEAKESLIMSDLAWPAEVRPLRCGTIVGFSSDNAKIFVELDNPAIEVHVSFGLKQCSSLPLDFRNISIIAPDTNRTVLRVGEPILVRAVGNRRYFGFEAFRNGQCLSFCAKPEPPPCVSPATGAPVTFGSRVFFDHSETGFTLACAPDSGFLSCGMRNCRGEACVAQIVAALQNPSATATSDKLQSKSLCRVMMCAAAGFVSNLAGPRPRCYQTGFDESQLLRITKVGSAQGGCEEEVDGVCDGDVVMLKFERSGLGVALAEGHVQVATPQPFRVRAGPAIDLGELHNSERATSGTKGHEVLRHGDVLFFASESLGRMLTSKPGTHALTCYNTETAPWSRARIVSGTPGKKLCHEDEGFLQLVESGEFATLAMPTTPLFTCGTTPSRSDVQRVRFEKVGGAATDPQVYAGDRVRVVFVVSELALRAVGEYDVRATDMAADAFVVTAGGTNNRSGKKKHKKF